MRTARTGEQPIRENLPLHTYGAMVPASLSKLRNEMKHLTPKKKKRK
jgi:hypothetical protein